MKLFISYAHKDVDRVKEIVALLENAGHEVWWDTALKAGQTWQGQLADEIANCDVFIYIMTSNSAWNKSEWCHWEFVTAVENNKPVLPLLLQKTDKKFKLPVVISRLQYADLTDGLKADTIGKMLSDLEALHIMHTDDLPPKPENPTGDPARVTINLTVTASDNAQVNVIGQIENQTNIEKQYIGEKESKSKSYFNVIVGIAGIIGAIFAGLALFPDQVQSFIENLQPTPLEGSPFAEGEVGIVIADFEAYGNEEGATENNIVAALEREDFLYVRVNHQIADREQAQQLSDLYNATIVMWGERQSAGIRVFYEITPPEDRYIYTTFDDPIAVPSDLDNFSTYILNGMDTLYIVNFTLGQLYYSDEDYETAIDFFNDAVASIPQDRKDDVEVDSLYFYRAFTKYKLGDHAGAIADYSQAIVFNPQLTNAYYNRGIINADLGNFKEAIEDYDQAISRNPEDANIYYNRGIANADLKMFQEAIEDYDQAISLNSQFVEAYNNRGIANANLENFEKAIKDYDQAIRFNPEFAEAYNHRGLAKAKFGKFEEAIEDFNQAITLNPEFVDAYNNRGLAKYNLDKIEDAITDFNETIMLNDQHADAYNNRGLAKASLGKYLDAVTDYDQAIILNPNLWTAYCNRAIALNELSEFAQALTDYKKCAELISDKITLDWVLERITELEALVGSED